MSMWRLGRSICLITVFTIGVARGADNFCATQDIVGRISNGLQTPDNQLVTPAGTQVELPQIRPNALALSPDGKLLVTSGRVRRLIVVDPATGRILQRVPFPKAAHEGAAESVSASILGANLKDKLSFTGLTFSPDGSRIYLSNVNGDIKVFSVAKDNTVAPLFCIALPRANKPGRLEDIPTGIAVSPDGKKLYVALNVSNRLLELDAATGKILRRWDVGVAPYAVVLAKNKVYVSDWGGRRPGPDSRIGPIGMNGTVRVDSRYIASEGSVSVIDLNGTNRAEIVTGKHACGLALSPNGRWVVVANAGSDTLSVIDTRTDKLIDTIWARQKPGDPFGAQPNALVFDRQGRHLFVCNGTQNAVAVFQFQHKSKLLGLFPVHHYQPGRAKLIGLIPVGWFPGTIAYDAQRRALDVANIKDITPTRERAAKGKGHGLGFNTKEFYGSLSLVPVPNRSELKRFTETALANMRYPLLARARLAPRPGRAPQPVPERVGEPSVIKHVIYIIKENRTYDQVLGDVREGNGDPDLCAFGEKVTPNQHKFVRDFVLLDNMYCSGIQSADGHQWTDSAIANDYVEREFAGWPRSYPGGGEPQGRDALAYSSAGFIWNDAAEHGKSIADFGEFTSDQRRWKNPAKTGEPGWLDCYRDFVSGSNAIVYSIEPDIEALRPYYITNYPGFDLKLPDVLRASRFIGKLKEYEAQGWFPDLTIVWLPNDHTTGTKPGAPQPAAQVADNDLAFGQMVEAFTHSPFWSNSCVFAIEDDPQDGWDHVSGYRTTAYVISPYAKRHAVVRTQYNQTSMVRTIELMLGLPPMNQMDATATPMFDCFTSTPDFTPYTALTNRIPLDAMNPDPDEISDAVLRRDARISARLPLDKEDQCPEDVFNRILWHATKGSQTPYPAWAVVSVDDDD